MGAAAGGNGTYDGRYPIPIFWCGLRHAKIASFN